MVQSPSNAEAGGLIPGQGTKILHAMGQLSPCAKLLIEKPPPCATAKTQCKQTKNPKNGISESMIKEERQDASCTEGCWLTDLESRIKLPLRKYIQGLSAWHIVIAVKSPQHLAHCYNIGSH